MNGCHKTIWTPHGPHWRDDMLCSNQFMFGCFLRNIVLITFTLLQIEEKRKKDMKKMIIHIFSHIRKEVRTMKEVFFNFFQMKTKFKAGSILWMSLAHTLFKFLSNVTLSLLCIFIFYKKKFQWLRYCF